MTQCLAIIPARSGSTGLAGKNLQEIEGVSLVGHAVCRASEVSWIDKVLISTDCQKIADEATSFGAECISLRPPQLATSDALAIDVWHHVWHQAETGLSQQRRAGGWKISARFLINTIITLAMAL